MLNYECESCGKRFKEGVQCYIPDENHNEVITSNSYKFSEMECIHATFRWISCPYCGSEDIIDFEDLV